MTVISCGPLVQLMVTCPDAGTVSINMSSLALFPRIPVGASGNETTRAGRPPLCWQRSNSPIWPSRSRCLVSVVTHALAGRHCAGSAPFCPASLAMAVEKLRNRTVALCCGKLKVAALLHVHEFKNAHSAQQSSAGHTTFLQTQRTSLHGL